MTKRLAVIVGLMLFLITTLGVLSIVGILVLPLWLYWAGLIAAGACVYTEIQHKGQSERFSLTMAMILLALNNLSWPQIGLATMVGVLLGQMVLSQGVLWYKRLYSAAAISLAGVVAEVFYTNVHHSLWTFIAAAIIFDVLTYLFYMPIWVFVAKQSVRDALTSYWETIFLTGLSIVIALVLGLSGLLLGTWAIVTWAVFAILFARPTWTVGLPPFLRRAPVQ